MSRIGSYGASQMYLSRLTVMQNRIFDEQTQVATEKKSVNYTGIAGDANRLINLENERMRAEKFRTDNDLATTRLKAADVSMTAIETEMKNFSERLTNYAQFGSNTETDVRALQDFAFQSMLNIQSYLGANIDGQYIFSGGRVANEPVILPARDLATFQELYDGTDHPFPTTRDASLQELHTTNADTGDLTVSVPAGTISAATAGSLAQIAPGSQITVGAAGNNSGQTYTVAAIDPTNTTVRVSKLLTSAGETGVTISVPGLDVNSTLPVVNPAEYGSVDFSGDGDVITFNAPTTFSTTPFAVGSVFHVSGSASVVDIDGASKTNDGVFEVSSISVGPPYQITVKSTKLTAEAGPVAATLDTDSWYRGDTIQLKQQIDSNRIIDLGVYASDPAFDKAFRAMGLIAQGAFGTAGSLEHNIQRVDDARYLIQDALSRNTTATGPFGVEQVGDINQLRGQVGVSLNRIKDTNEKHTSFSGFLELRIINLENVDKTEAVTRLLDDQQALETSYKALATVRGVSLLDYVK